MPDNTNESVESLLKENLELSRAIYAEAEKTRRYIFYGKILEVVKIVFIVGPIIAGALYLGPLLKQALSLYGGLLGGENFLGNNLDKLKELQELQQ